MSGPYSLSGSGTQTLSAGVTALVIVPTLPANYGAGRASPTNYYDLGLIRPGSANGFLPALPVDAPTQWLPLPIGTDRIGYAFLHGSSAVVTEIFSTSPLSSPLIAIISPQSPESIGVNLAATAASAGLSVQWQTANTAILVPFRLSVPFVITKAFVPIIISSAHVDIGVYDAQFNRLGSTGSQATAALMTTAALSLTLQPGQYYMAMSADANTARFLGSNIGGAGIARLAGCLQMASAFPLPSVFVPVAATFVTVVGFGLSSLSVNP
jgi:hypothetical protein